MKLHNPHTYQKLGFDVIHGEVHRRLSSEDAKKQWEVDPTNLRLESASASAPTHP